MAKADYDPMQNDPSGITDFSTDQFVNAQVPLYNTRTQQAEMHCLTYAVTDQVDDNDLFIKKCGEIDNTIYSQGEIYHHNIIFVVIINSYYFFLQNLCMTILWEL